MLWKDLIPDSLRGTTPNPPPTFVDVHLQDLLLADDLAAAAGFTAVLVADAAALALAALAHAGHLLDHTHPQLVVRTCMPVPWHDMHISTAPLRPPRPGQRAERRTMVRRRSAFTALLRPLQINGVPALMTQCDTLYQYCYSQDKT